MLLKSVGFGAGAGAVAGTILVASGTVVAVAAAAGTCSVRFDATAVANHARLYHRA